MVKNALNHIMIEGVGVGAYCSMCGGGSCGTDLGVKPQS